MKSDPTISHGNTNLPSQSLATVHHEQSDYEDGLAGSSTARRGSGGRTPIRERLRKWEEENPTEAEMMISDLSSVGELTNNLTRPQNVATIQLDIDATSPLFAGDELVDLRSDDAMLDPGDLVELQYVI